jgi:Multicopper oxidase
MQTLGRRHFIRYSMCGMSAVALGSGMASALLGGEAQAASRVVELSMEEALVEMVDATRVFHWVFQLKGSPRPSFPGPSLFAFTGDAVTLRVTNNLDEPHEFRILGAGPSGEDINSVPAVIAPGATAVVRFTPRVAGSFMYVDPRNAPVNRVLGLHGAFVVLPAGVRARSAINTPYTRPTRQVQRLFDDLGRSAEFPGDPWFPVRPAGERPLESLPADLERFLFRSRIWLFHQVDPRVNAIAENGGNAEPGGGIDRDSFIARFLPRYFLISGKSGAFAAHDPAISLEGFIGEPHLVRTLNAGLATPSLHLHSNHFGVLAINNVVQESAPFIDTMTLRTVEGDRRSLSSAIPAVGQRFLNGASRVDWLVPFQRPPDIPGNPKTPLRELLREELALVIGDVPQSPLAYPMHDHMEQSQTAAGGNYPQGDITDIIFLGDVDKVRFPIPRVDSNGRAVPSRGHRSTSGGGQEVPSPGPKE